MNSEIVAISPQQSETKFERIVEINPAWDKRDPNPSKNYGIHCAELRMILKGDQGATQFVLYTGWYLPGTSEVTEPFPCDLGYHSPFPRYGEQASFDCDILPGGKCYYDGSGLNAERIYDVLLREGSEGVWRELEEYYHKLFDVVGDED